MKEFKMSEIKALIKECAEKRAMEHFYERMIKEEQRNETICEKISNFFRYLCR